MSRVRLLMAKLPVIEDQQFERLLKATVATSRMPERDAALLLTLCGTAMAVTELATITVDCFLRPDGAVKITSSIPVEVAHNGEERPLYWSNKRVVSAMEKYLEWRFENTHGVTIKKGAYRGLDPESPIFLTDEGHPYALTKRKLASGGLSYSCNTLGAHITRLHSNAGVDGNAQAARRTMAVKLHRKGYDLVHVAAILGHRSITTTKRLVDGDPVRLADIVAGAV